MKNRNSQNGLAGKTAGLVVVCVALSVTSRAHGDEQTIEGCERGLTTDGKETRTGTCDLVLRIGSKVAYSARVETAKVIIDNAEYELEIERGSVRGVAGSHHPRFLIRGTKHFAEVDIESKGSVWVYETGDGKVATVESESGVTLLVTSWGDKRILAPNEAQTIKLEAPEPTVEPSNCSIRWTGRAPENGDMWLAVAASLYMLVLQRRKRRL